MKGTLNECDATFHASLADIMNEPGGDGVRMRPVSDQVAVDTQQMTLVGGVQDAELVEHGLVQQCPCVVR
jgi:hypothetical protein